MQPTAPPGSGGENGALASLQDGQPIRQVLHGVGPGLDGDSKLSARERRAKLGDQLFHGMGFTDKSPGQVTIAPMGGGGPVAVMPISGLCRANVGTLCLSCSTRVQVNMIARHTRKRRTSRAD
jgi:hypothetical protein